MTESQVFDEILMAWHIRHLLGDQYAGVDYSETRFQRVSASHLQVLITYDGARNFSRISQNEVENNLENGVLQIKAGNIEDLKEDVLKAFEDPLEHPAIVI